MIVRTSYKVPMDKSWTNPPPEAFMKSDPFGQIDYVIL